MTVETTSPSTVADDAAATVVEVVGLSKSYAGPPTVCALQPCDLTIQAGEFVAVTGPSGSGKSTLLSLLGLLDEPTSGRYRLDGVDVARVGDPTRAAIRAHKIGFVFQAFHLLDYRSVLDNVQLGLSYQGLRRDVRRRRAVAVIARVGLTHRLHADCSTLSGGEQQRVAIARVLVREPSLVLCDEPTGNLDSATSEQVLTLLEHLHDDGLTIVVITHDPAVAERAHRHLRIVDGVVTEGAVSR